MSVPLDFEGFCHQAYLPLVRMLTLYCGDPDVARDLAQECMIRVGARWRAVQRMDNPRGWAWRVAVNLANSHYRRSRVEQRAISKYQGWARPTATSPDPSLTIVVRGAMQTLPRRQREALVLRYFQDLPVAETAEAMGCSKGTVKKLTARGLVGLRSALGPELCLEAVRDGG